MSRVRQINQQQLRMHIEHNMDTITEIFRAHKDSDYKNTVSLLVDEVFRKANPELSYSRIDKSSGYLAEDKLRNSLEFTIKKHKGQYRDSGVHYASHPVHNGYLMAEFGFGEDLIVSAHLHDIPEENEYVVLNVLDEVKIRFGKEILDNILALSIFEKGEERDEKQIHNLWCASVRMNNYDVLYLKLADVISNLYTKKDMHGKNGMTAEERQRKYSMNAEKNILPVAQLIDDMGCIDLHVTSYLQELIRR